MEKDVPAWDQAVKKGVCTMSPDVGKWLLECCGKDAGRKESKIALSLDVTKEMLEKRGLLKNAPDGERHMAGYDAMLHRAVYVSLQELCKVCKQVS